MDIMIWGEFKLYMLNLCSHGYYLEELEISDAPEELIEDCISRLLEYPIITFCVIYCVFNRGGIYFTVILVEIGP